MLKNFQAKNYANIFSWSVHLLTSSGALLALWGLHAISIRNFSLTLKILIITIIIDAIDGPLARYFKVKENTPSFDGTLLDYIVDFTTWVILPAFCLLQSKHLLFFVCNEKVDPKFSPSLNRLYHTFLVSLLTLLLR